MRTSSRWEPETCSHTRRGANAQLARRLKTISEEEEAGKKFRPNTTDKTMQLQMIPGMIQLMQVFITVSL